MRLSGGGYLLHDRDPRDTHRSGWVALFQLVHSPKSQMLMYLIESRV